MHTLRTFRSLAPAALALLSASCTLLRVGAHEDDGPARLELEGIVEGHLAVGISDERDLVDLDLFEGRSSGALAELTVWKLLRLELGLVGATVALGPLELGLGVLGYDPEPWAREADRSPADEPPPAPTVEDAERPAR